jgi:hypothetical protein
MKGRYSCSTIIFELMFSQKHMIAISSPTNKFELCQPPPAFAKATATFLCGGFGGASPPILRQKIPIQKSSL